MAMNLPTVTFETKCYEKDWEILLKTNRLEEMIARNRYDFTEKLLYINNVDDPDKVVGYAERLKQRGVISDYIMVDDYANEALLYFGLDRESFRGGYYYSIQELVGIYRCRTDYLLHFSGDSILDGAFSWLDRAIDLLGRDSRIKVVNCIWNRKVHEAECESIGQDKDFWIGYGFSDQCYLVKRSDFNQRIYHNCNPVSERYPHYGGELFEKRVDAWMRNNNYLRGTYKHGSYVSKNFPRTRLVRTVGRLLGVYDR